MSLPKIKLNLQLFNDGEESANTQEVAEPVEQVEQEPQQPTETNEPSDDVFVDDDVSEPKQKESQGENMQEVAEPAKPAQSDTDNNKYAAARRKAEAELQAIKAQQNNLARDLG